MERSFAVEPEETDSSTETESLLKKTWRRVSDPETDTSTCVSVTSGEVARQIKAVIDPLTHQLAHFCQLMQELRNELAPRRHEETTSSRAASKSTGSAGQSGNKYFHKRSTHTFRAAWLKNPLGNKNKGMSTCS